ncbi:MAG TPA: HAD family hydrolase [Gaiella sp.]|jgi:HAD superfamily hydrolase (TIGR01549 family)|nr:HAD family hydrolase [Gaiella sp.]
MPVRAVFFDVGETLVDEQRYWRAMAEAAGVGPHVVWAALGKTIERGEEHWDLWRHLGLDRPQAWDGLVYSLEDLYPDALACLERTRGAGMVVGLAGNQSAQLEEWARSARLPVDIVTGSASLGVRKPDRAFFRALVDIARSESGEVAYVGDRADNDVAPALEAGLVAVHVRRGPWGRLQRTPRGAIVVESLEELPDALASAR